MLDENYVEPTTIPVPEWDGDAEDGALDAAEAALQAYGRTDLDAEQWWAQLEPLVAPAAQEWFSYVDPRNVPEFVITGDPALAEEQPSAWIAWVIVPTDRGDFTTLLSREDGSSPWLVERIELPEELAS